MRSVMGHGSWVMGHGSLNIFLVITVQWNKNVDIKSAHDTFLE
jgi:hypothetical protein